MEWLDTCMNGWSKPTISYNGTTMIPNFTRNGQIFAQPPVSQLFHWDPLNKNVDLANKALCSLTS